MKFFFERAAKMVSLRFVMAAPADVLGHRSPDVLVSRDRAGHWHIAFGREMNTRIVLGSGAMGLRYVQPDFVTDAVVSISAERRAMSAGEADKVLSRLYAGQELSDDQRVQLAAFKEAVAAHGVREINKPDYGYSEWKPKPVAKKPEVTAAVFGL